MFDFRLNCPVFLLMAKRLIGLLTKYGKVSAYLFALACFGLSSHSMANDDTNTILGGELEQLKKQVLSLNRDLFILEEDLLYPASTQIAVFVSVDIGRFFSLDSVELKIDGEPVVGFLYTDRQRIALEQGGLQRLYLGNVKAGKHQLTAIFTGKDKQQRAVKRAKNFSFIKEEEAVMIELSMVDASANYQADIKIEQWAH